MQVVSDTDDLAANDHFSLLSTPRPLSAQLFDALQNRILTSFCMQEYTSIADRSKYAVIALARPRISTRLYITALHWVLLCYLRIYLRPIDDCVQLHDLRSRQYKHNRPRRWPNAIDWNSFVPCASTCKVKSLYSLSTAYWHVETLHSPTTIPQEIEVVKFWLKQELLSVDSSGSTNVAGVHRRQLSPSATYGLSSCSASHVWSSCHVVRICALRSRTCAACRAPLERLRGLQEF